MKPRILYNIIAHFFMILFLYTGIAKLMDMHGGFANMALPLAELSVVVLLFMPAWRLRGLWGSLILISLFTIYLLTLIFRNNNVYCNCGGIIENLRPGQHLIFNFACIILAWIGIASARYQKTPIDAKFKWITSSLSLLSAGLIGFTIINAATTPPAEITGKEGATLPSFNLLLTDSTTHLNTRDIPAGQPFIVMEFSPYCPHCKREIADITSNIKKFHHTHFYLISTFPITDIRKLSTQFSLDKYSNITVGMDTTNAILKYFNWHAIPFTTIYDSRKKLARAFYGRAEIATLTQCMAD
jgi:peroxiredoxin